MSQLTEYDILGVLKQVMDNDSGKDVVSSGMISGLSVRGNKAGFLITIDPQDRARKAYLQSACEKAVLSLPGIESVTAVLTGQESEARSQKPEPLRKAVWNTTPIPHVKRILAVASGKGGVGKSTTAVNLAHALSTLGQRTGLLDADIYGPSIPRMMGLNAKPEVKDDKIIPLKAHGTYFMSMGLLVGEESALVWRGPQMSKALHQMLRGIAWGSEEAPLDTLLIDMPPGTGDIHLSLVQQAPVNGAIIVTTPQEVAVADARKCIDMFRKVNVPVIGIIENMSGFTDPATGNTHAIFGEGGGKRLAESTGVAFLAEIPIVMNLRIASDAGSKFEDTQGIYKTIAAQL